MTATYQGPFVGRNAESVKNVRMRLQTEVSRIADRRHAEAVMEWAVGNDTPYPVFNDAVAEATEEVQLLATALGMWAAVDPYIWNRTQAKLRRGRRPSILGDFDFGI